jgi:hypothetical protein
VFDHAPHRRAAPKQATAAFDVARSERLPNGSGRHATDPIERDRSDALDLEARGAAGTLEQGQVAPGTVTEVEVLAHDDRGRREVTDQIVHERGGIFERSLLVEPDHVQDVDPELLDSLGALAKVREQTQAGLWPHDRRRMPIERDHDRGGAERGGGGHRALDDHLVADVDAVEHPGAQDSAPGGRRDRAALVDDLHAAEATRR